MQQQILEIELVLAHFEVFVAGVERGDLGDRPRGDAMREQHGRRVVVGRALQRLHPLDLRGNIAKVGRRKPQPQPPGDLGKQRNLRLQDRWQLAANGAWPEVLQLPQCGGVERTGLDGAGTEAAQPTAKFAGSPGGEGDGKNVSRRDRAGTDRERDAVGDRPGLAGARAGQDADRAANRLGRRSLLGIERAQDLRFSHRGHRAILAGPTDTAARSDAKCDRGANGNTCEDSVEEIKARREGRTPDGRQLS